MTFSINTSTGMLSPAKFVPTKNFAGPYTMPLTLLVMHYTASGRGIDNDAAFFADQHQTSASAHLLVGEDGAVIQCVPFTMMAHHAGASTWRGRIGCNSFALGIEIDNWGILTKREDGTFRSSTGVIIPASEVVQAKHKNGGPLLYWQAYKEPQLKVLEEITRAILLAYPTITEVVGHDDVAPSRKTDPGPAFPMRRFQQLTENRAQTKATEAVTIPDALRVRSGPGTNFNILAWSPLMKGTIVKVLNDGPDWDLIEVAGKQGWVSSPFLQPRN